MRKDNKVKVVMSVGIINIGLLVTGLIVGCLSWFSITNKFNPVNLFSSVVTEYFDSRDPSVPADGTENNPFVITKPVHLYNLIGLHETDKLFTIAGRETKFYEAGAYFEMGRDFDNDGDHEFYEYDDDGHISLDEEGNPIYTNYLNMSYYSGQNALTPLGTASRPFMGHIIGHNKTIQNLHIDGRGCADIGVFGYTSRDATVQDLYLDSIDIDARNGDPNEYNTLYHTQIHSFVNVGYIAGHVESNLSFTNVYVNNCQIRNSVENTEIHNNDYGYFGYAEGNSNPIANGEGFEYQLNPDKLYNYLDTNYGSIKGNSLVLRNDYSGTGVGTVSNAISHSASGGDHYTITGTNQNNPGEAHSYAWNTLGYQEGDSINNIWYKQAEQYLSFPTNTSVMEEEPLTAGNYLYYNGLNWDYYQNTATAYEALGNFAGNRIFFIQQKPDLTQPIWTWFWSSSRHYIRRGTGRTGQPDPMILDTNNGQDLTIVDRPGVSTNLDSPFIDTQQGISMRSDVCRTIYIMDHMPTQAPFKTKYVYVQKGTMELVWGEYSEASDPSKSVACAFSVSTILGAALYFKIGAVKYTVGYVGGVLKAAPVGQITPVYFVVGGGGANDAPDLSSDCWRLCTSLSDINTTDDYTLAYADSTATLQSGPVEVIAKKQAANYRKSISNESLSNEFCDNPDGASYKIVRNSDNTYSFLDNDNGGGYLTAHSSVYDSLRVGPIYESNSHFRISFQGNSTVDLVAQGDSTHNKLRYVTEEGRFTCVEDGGVRPYLFKRIKNGFRHVFRIGSYSQGCWANYAGVETTKFPVYFSQPGQTVYTQLTDDPDVLGEFNFEAEGYESTSTVEMSSTAGAGTMDGWVRCMERGDLEAGAQYIIATYTYDHCATAGGLVNGHLESLNGSAFGGNGKVITDLDPHAMIFTLRGSKDTGWQLEADGGNLGATGYDALTIGSPSAEDRWDITFAGNFYVTIENWDEDCGKIAFNAEEGNPRFTTMMFGKEILLYKKTNEQADVTYLADEVTPTDPHYNSSVIDPVGGCSIYSNYIEMDGGRNVRSILDNDATNASNNKTGDQFFHMYNINDVIMVRIPNTGSLDFGTLIVEGESADPVMVKGQSPAEEGKREYIQFNDPSIMCYNELDVQNKFKYTLSLNTYNIFNVSYCALDDEGNILSSYDTTGGQETPVDGEDIEQSSISEFILLLGGSSTTSKTKITKVTYKFNAAQGNMINFGLVGYRTAQYGSFDDQGDYVELSSKVTGPVMNFEYTLSNNGGYVYAFIEYTKDETKGKYVYNITFRCSESVHLIVFNYDAQRELIKVNGEWRQGAFNDILIPATQPPTIGGGWLK